MGCMLWILMVIWYIHNTDAKCRKTKGIPHMCGTAFGHIGETRMEKFHYDGFWSHLIKNHLTLATFLRKCEVTKIPFTGHKERATNLLVIIHFDVCSPINVVASSGFYLSSEMTQVDIWISTWWDVSLDLLKSFERFSKWSRNYCNKKNYVSAIRLRKGIFELQV